MLEAEARLVDDGRRDDRRLGQLKSMIRVGRIVRALDAEERIDIKRELVRAEIALPITLKAVARDDCVLRVQLIIEARAELCVPARHDDVAIDARINERRRIDERRVDDRVVVRIALLEVEEERSLLLDDRA